MDVRNTMHLHRLTFRRFELISRKKSPPWDTLSVQSAKKCRELSSNFRDFTHTRSAVSFGPEAAGRIHPDVVKAAKSSHSPGTCRRSHGFLPSLTVENHGVKYHGDIMVNSNTWKAWCASAEFWQTGPTFLRLRYISHYSSTGLGKPVHQGGFWNIRIHPNTRS